MCHLCVFMAPNSSAWKWLALAVFSTTSLLHIPVGSLLRPCIHLRRFCWKTQASLPQKASTEAFSKETDSKKGCSYKPPPAKDRATHPDSPPSLAGLLHPQPRSMHQSSQNNSSNMTGVSSAPRRPLGCIRRLVSKWQKQSTHKC